MKKLPRIAITTGEPAGIGPDLCCMLAQENFSAELIFIGDANTLQDRANKLSIDVDIHQYDSSAPRTQHLAGQLKVLHTPCSAEVTPGQLNTDNGAYVLETLKVAAEGCINKTFDAIATAPVHKGIINEAGVSFSGHTELFGEICAEKTGQGKPVMMLATQTNNRDLRVALATTHLPLNKVSESINADSLSETIRILNDDLKNKFGIEQPRILVCGLNPHAGEDGHMGMEEIEVISPCLETLRAEGINLIGPLPADTLFTEKHLKDADAALAMYHDQGLPVLKYAGFGNAVNITLGLPIIRTSVDHGTALDLAGTGDVHSGSFKAAINEAIRLVHSSISK